MGISLKDFASFAEGAIERDRELTKEDFEIRNANLAANRDMLIKQKNAKYEKELERNSKSNSKIWVSIIPLVVVIWFVIWMFLY